MQTLQRFATIAAVFTLTCFTAPVVCAATAPEANKAGAGTGTGPQPEGLGKEATVAKGGLTTANRKELEGGPGAGNATGREVKESGVEGLTLAERVRALQAQYRVDQREVYRRYQEMLRQIPDVKAQERDRIREQLRLELSQFREELMQRQKELRNEYRRRFEEFKKGHPEHQELIDGARERARETVRGRRGHGAD